MEDRATAIGVSPDSSKVFVAGFSAVGTNPSYPDDYMTIAYNASTGARMWAAHYNGPAGRNDIPHALAVSPDGTKVFVTGQSTGLTSNDDYATIAYHASNGKKLWAKRYDGSDSAGDDIARAVSVSPDGATVFVTGGAASTSQDYATVAYDASTGARRWARTYDGPGHGSDAATAVAVSPDGSEVFVTGASFGSTFCCDYATVAYSAATGGSCGRSATTARITPETTGPA